jgi:pimeloyl-ACP methyl ester carboxylesterase
LILAIAGAAYEQIGSRMDARRSPEPGRLVDLGVYRLKINCTGSGSPVVILESGLGDVLPEWERVQAGISSFSRACSYDRGGYGESDAGPMPRTSLEIAHELHALLQNAGEHPPYILVGHSFGGYNARVFGGQYPNEVAGMVLADTPQEDQYELLPVAWKQFSADLLRRWQNQAMWLPPQIFLGIARLRYRRRLGPYGYLILQSKYLKARASELEEMRTSAEQARASGTLGDKPLLVLTAAQQDESLRAALTQQDFDRFQELWVKIIQTRLVALSTRGRQIILSDVGHDIPTQRPEAIVNAVRDVRSAR